MGSSKILTRIAQQLDTKQANTLFINGGPGTGKSTLLESLSEDCAAKFPRARVLGPYIEVSTNPISRQLVEDLHDLGYVPDMPNQHLMDDLNSTWHWLERNLDISIKQSFIILVDLDQITWNDYDSFRVIFSSLRYLEHFWESKKAQFVFVLAGFWDDAGLDEHYNQINLSFPYTTGSNYLVWDGIGSDDFVGHYGEIDPLLFQKRGFIKVMHEIAGGNPAVMGEIAQKIIPDDLTLLSLLAAARAAAVEGQYSKRIQECLQQVPAESLAVLKKLLVLRQIPVISLSPAMQRLHSMGIVKEKVSKESRHLVLQSWFIELMLRALTQIFGLPGSSNRQADIADLMPTITVLNQNAFELLQEIEILLRNFVVTQLWDQQPDGLPLLTGWYYQSSFVWQNGDRTRLDRDTQEVANDWRERCQENGLPDQLNPDIAYTSLTTLAGILTELGRKEGSKRWEKVVEAVEEVVNIRDAVMHNQLIEFDDFEKILMLKNKISVAVSEEYREISASAG